MAFLSRFFKKSISIVFFLLAGFVLTAQSEQLQERYNQLVEKSETYQRYKVIVKQDLDQVWVEVQDTIRDYQSRIAAQQQTIADMERQLANQGERITLLEEQLQELTGQVDSISFLGIAFSKGSYHTFVWGIILILITGILLVYAMQMRARGVSRSTSAQFKALQEEFEAFKERARAKEVKVKRELQTALNSLDEFKRGLKK